MAKAEWVFPLDHPVSQGHFPGNPIIPGALLLAEALQAIENNRDATFSHCRLVAAKFLYPVRPGDRILIEFFSTDNGRTRFACQVGERCVLTGLVQWSALSTA